MRFWVPKILVSRFLATLFLDAFFANLKASTFAPVGNNIAGEVIFLEFYFC